MKKHKNLCPQFHLSMQSGSDGVLKRMKRKYTTAEYLAAVTLLKEHFPGCAITTDMIVAFPGETEEEFEESLAFIEKCGFVDMHIFPYSRRPGTPADKMSGQLPNSVKEERSRRAIAVAEKMRKDYCSAHLGKTVQVLFEQEEKGLFAGHTDNYLKVYVNQKDLHNQLLSVKITGLLEDGLLGETV